MYGWTSLIEEDNEEIKAYQKQEVLHAAAYCQASDVLKTHFMFPKWDQDLKRTTDIDDLSSCFRANVILDNQYFSDRVRVESCKTYLPFELEKQLAVWKRKVNTKDHHPDWISQDWLEDFFVWTQRCIENDFGLYLDY